MINLTWKELRERFKDGEPFVIEDPAFPNGEVNMFTSGFKLMCGDPEYDAVVTKPEYVVTLVDWFEPVQYMGTVYIDMEECSKSTRCTCDRCTEYDKLYNK